jgi:ABC-type transporter Mla subunit MlaD
MRIFYQGWLDKYLTNRKQFDKDMEVLIENEKDYYLRIKKFIDTYISNVVNNQGQMGSIRAIEKAAEKARASSGLNGGITGTGNGIAEASKAAAAASKKAAEAIKAATKAANEQAEAYIKAAEAAAEFMSATRSMVDGFRECSRSRLNWVRLKQLLLMRSATFLTLIDSALADGHDSVECGIFVARVCG